MTDYVLLITLGPVQDFIAQARRTRDLWFGSHLLSEVSRTVARSLANTDRVVLIFPALDRGHPELKLCQRLLRPEAGLPPLNIANKIEAIVSADDDAALETIARTARTAVMDDWRNMAAGVRHECAKLIASDVVDVWAEQIDSLLDFTAAWAPIVNDDYKRARDTVDQAISSRKMLRDFGPWRQQRQGVPSSSLDGARQTVLREPNDRDPDWVRRYRISKGEQLDAVGLVKRAGGKPEQFVPVINVALAPWIIWARTKNPAVFKDIEGWCREQADINGSWTVRSNIPCGEAFPYNASLLLTTRREADCEDLGWTEKDDPRIKRLKSLQEALIRSPSREPFPYVACLVADGDKMGTAIDSLTSHTDRRTFSKQMSQFAQKARTIVETQHCGLLIYSGGDDVLAFLPVSTAIACARTLSEAFAEIMTEACRNTAIETLPTLSVGIGIGHMLEGMGDLLTLGRDAEKMAKKGAGLHDERNALALIIDKRSGGRRHWRRQWTEEPDVILDKARRLLSEGTVPIGKLYQVEQALRRFPKSEQDGRSRDPKPLWLIRETLQILRHTDATCTTFSPAEFGLWDTEPETYAKAHAAILEWINHMAIAKTLCQAIPGQEVAP
jgi:CRISPR-associated protein Cmr2